MNHIPEVGANLISIKIGLALGKSAPRLRQLVNGSQNQTSAPVRHDATKTVGEVIFNFRARALIEYGARKRSQSSR